MAPNKSASVKTTVRRFMMVPGIAVQRLSGLAEPAGFLFDRKLRPPRATVSLAVHDTAAAPPRGLRRQQGEIHGQIAFDHRLSGACRRPAVDRSGHRRDSLAAV